MKRLFTFICLLFSGSVIAQTSADYVVQLTAQVQKSPAQITLKWKTLTGSGTYNIFRKAKTATTWGTAIANVGASATTYIDNSVTAGNTYEYAVVKSDEPSYGYILAGIEVPAMHNKGALVLLVDSTFIDSCTTEINQLMKDISGDGWEVLRKDYSRSATVATIKSHIVNTYQANNNLKAVLVLGHLSVPYSGNYDTTAMVAPDGHLDHAGAWPADLFYGDIDGIWTDNISNTMGTRAPNKNLPGDGKYDQTQIPSNIDLQVGRVDFANMPALPRTEIQMMRNYLNKAHSHKTGGLSVTKRALIDDNFGKMNGEGFSAAAYRLSPIVHSDSVKVLDFVSTLKSSSYLWGFGCGAGSFSNCSGVAHTDSFKTNNVRAIFTILFGSYFGDWNVQNNLLRAPLCAAEPALTSCWSGRPHWYFHHMALGENIGYSTLITQNNGNTYANKVNIYPTAIHPALMGDPTLRTEYVKPVPSVTLTNDTNAGVKVTWTASPEPGLAGYYVYRSKTEFGEYKLRSGMVTGTAYTDSFGSPGTYWYMVRATKLQTTPSGTYYNLSLGTSNSGTFKYPKFDVGINELTLITEAMLYPNPAKETVQLSISSTQQTKATVNITDLQGKVLSNSTMNLIPGSNTQQLDISNLPAGMYLVHIYTDTERKTLKMAKTY